MQEQEEQGLNGIEVEKEEGISEENVLGYKKDIEAEMKERKIKVFPAPETSSYILPPMISIWRSLEFPTQMSRPQAAMDKAVMDLLQLFLNWLQVLVGHLDSAEIIMDHIFSKQQLCKSISLSILAVPKTTNMFLP